MGRRGKAVVCREWNKPVVVEEIEVVSRGDVRRAKLYYLRDRVGKAAKVREKRDN